MRSRYLGAAAIILLLAACSTAEDGPADSTDSTSTESDDTNQTSAVTTTGNTTAQSGGTSTSQTSSAGTGTTAISPTTQPVNSSASNASDTTDDETEDPTDTSDDTETDGQTDDDASAPDETSTDPGEDSASETTSEPGGETSDDEDMVEGVDDNFSFFVTSYYHMALLADNEDGFGGDLRYNGAATGLEGADAICQEIARRVGFGSKTWRAYLSTSTVNAIDRIGSGPWYDFVGAKVADTPEDLISGANRQPGGCCEEGTYDEMGLFHDGTTDQNNDGIDDDDHDTMTATQGDGTYAGFSCEDWTSKTAMSEGGGGGQGGGGQGGGPGGGGGIMMGHSWPARSGEHWATSHGGHQCAAGTNFIQDGGGDSSTVGGGGGYGGIYCFALAE